MAFIGTFSRALLESATAVYFGGVSVSILDAQGNVILGDDLPDAPTVTSTIADRTYAVGDAAVTVDLRTKFNGATSYTVTPTNAAVTIDGYTLTINPAAAMTSTSFTVRGVNGGGSSAPLAFTLTVTAPAPVLEKPFPDQSLLIGGGTVTLPLAEYFSGATGYAVSPANNGVTISNGNLVISRTTARDVIITVTATNATGQDTSDSFALLVAAPANQAPVASAIPQQNPTANTAFTVDLSSYFVDPEGAALSFDYTGTLPTGITRNGAVFSGTATVTDQTANGVLRARDPGNLEAEAPVTWAVSAQPAITATIDLQPAGQQSSITFNVAIKGLPTITQGQQVIPVVRDGTTNRWIFIAQVAGPISFFATQDGYTPLNESRTVTAAAAEIFVASDNTAEIQNLKTSSPSDSLKVDVPARYAGTYAYAPSQLATGPIILKAPFISGTGEPGTDIVLDLALQLGATSWEGAPYVGGVANTDSTATSYAVLEADRGKSIDWRGMFLDSAGGETPFQTNSIIIPAAVPDLVFDTFTVQADTYPRLAGYTGERGVVWTERGGTLQINGDTGRVQGSGGSCYTGPADAGMVQGVVSNIARGSNTARRGTGPMIRATATSLVRVKMPLFSTSNIIEVSQTNNGTTTTLFSTPAPASWETTGALLKVELKTDANNIVHLLLNDVPSGQAATVLTGGACGLYCESGSNNLGAAEPTDFACWGSNQ